MQKGILRLTKYSVSLGYRISLGLKNDGLALKGNRVFNIYLAKELFPHRVV